MPPRRRSKKGSAAALSQIAADHPEAERIEVWFQDEARVGQKVRMVRRWFQRGMRPRMVKDQRYRSAYIAGAVCPARDTGAALVLTHVSVAALNRLLEELASQLSPGTRAAMPIDNAGWHTANDLRGPNNITLVHLPPSSPELNAIKRVWQDLRDRYLSGRLFPGTRAMVDACCDAWNSLVAETSRIHPLTDFEWARQIKP
ncbi:MAG: IS630 family transposase [Roseococcus sp.]|nr:IS630 family transposase [Roseococcus sp.]